MFDHQAMCRDVSRGLWDIYHSRPDAPHLMLPTKRDGVLRVSEQESKILITQWLQAHDISYSIETPTVGRYQQSGQAEMSARIDVTAYECRDACKRAMHMELKAGTASLEAFRKDFEKLLCEHVPGLWFHTLESASQATWRTLAAKMDEALNRLAPHADNATHTIWFAFCVLDRPQLIQFEMDFNTIWRNQSAHLMYAAGATVIMPPYEVGPTRKSVATRVVQPSYGASRKLLVYAPTIDPSTFLHLSIKGESYALRMFPSSGPPRRWVLADLPTTSALLAAHPLAREIDVAPERKSLEGEVEYWRSRIAALNGTLRIEPAR